MTEQNQANEMLIVSIIASAGEANGYLQMAFQETVAGNLTQAQTYVDTANQALAKAHDAHHDLLEQEACGNIHGVTLLLVHAQDHLMNVVLSKQMLENMMLMQRQINELKGEVK